MIETLKKRFQIGEGKKQLPFDKKNILKKKKTVNLLFLKKYYTLRNKMVNRPWFSQ